MIGRFYMTINVIYKYLYCIKKSVTRVTLRGREKVEKQKVWLEFV